MINAIITKSGIAIVRNVKDIYQSFLKAGSAKRNWTGAKREFQRNYVFNMKPGMEYKEVVNRMLAQKAYQSSIIMFHPDERDIDSRLVYSYDPKGVVK